MLEDFVENEGETGFMPVKIFKNSEKFIANPVTFLVIPMTIAQAKAEGLIPGVLTVEDDDNSLAPITAG